MSSNSEIILYEADEALQLEVRIEEETVWLTQSQMTVLFETTKQNISLHINNVFKEKELDKNSTVKYFLIVQSEGNRIVRRNFTISTSSFPLVTA